MEITEFQVSYAILMEWQIETFRIDRELWQRQYVIGGFKKYKGFSDNQLFLIRNHLHRKIDIELNNLINERRRVK